MNKGDAKNINLNILQSTYKEKEKEKEQLYDYEINQKHY